MIALALALIAGLPVARLADRNAPLLRWIGEAMLLGIAICAGVLFAISCIGVNWTLTRFAIVMIVISAALALRIRRAPIARERWHVFDLLTLATLIGYALFATIAPPAEIDFIADWGLKAAVFANHGGIDWSFLQNAWYRWDHPDYPPLLPLAFDAMTLGHGGTPASLNVWFAAALILILRSLFADELPPAHASLATFAIAPLAMSPWIGIADGPLVAFGTACVLLARRRSMTVAALLLGCAAMTKNEGFALLVAVAIALMVTRRFRDLPRLWPAVAIALPWMIVRAMLSLTSDITRGALFSRALARLRDPGEILAALKATTGGAPLIWLGIAIALVAGFRFVRDEAFALTSAATQLASYIGVYFATANDVAWQVRWSWERLVTHVMPVLAFVAVVILYRFSQREASA
jgi:hypothetical protein